MSVDYGGADDFELNSGADELAVRLGDDVNLLDVELSESGLRKTIEADDTRTLKGMEEAVSALEDYLVAKDGQYLVMEDRESGDMLVLPHSHRFTADYRKRTYARLKCVERHVTQVWDGDVPTTLLTLTAPHKDENGQYRPFDEVLKDIKEGWNKLRRVIRRETEGVKTEYLAVYEPHATGYPHLHVLIFGVARESLGEKVTDYWVDRYVEGASRDAQDVTVKRGRSVDLESPAAYIMKYLSKTLARESESHDTALESLPSISGFLPFSALMWATDSRTYSMSEGLSRAVSEAAPEYDSVEGDWVFVGTVRGVEAGMYTGDEAEKLRKFLGESRNQTAPPRRSRERYGKITGVG